ncbi:MAG: hypothetical protein ACOY0T_15160 [Myxococcota bacterium]
MPSLAASEAGTRGSDNVAPLPSTPTSERADDCTGSDTSTDTSLAAPRPVPVSGSLEPNGLVNLVLDATSRFPIVFRVHRTGLEEVENGYRVRGSVLLEVPGDVITLKHADLTFEYGEDRASADLRTKPGDRRARAGGDLLVARVR